MALDCSVLITCYNKEKYIDETISSVLRQTRQPKEIIVVHDGCKKPVHHAKVTSIFLKNNVGVAKARHEAFRFSTGKLILFVDGDDVLSPDYLEKMAMVIFKGADIAYPDLFLWSETASRLVVTPNKITKQWVKDMNKVVIPVTSMFDRSLYEKLGGFGEFQALEDLDFFVRAMCNGCIFKKAQTLLWYRQVEGNRNTLALEKKKQILEGIMKQLK